MRKCRIGVASMPWCRRDSRAPWGPEAYVSADLVEGCWSDTRAKDASTTTANEPMARAPKEAIRAPKRQISNVVYRSLVTDARRVSS